MGRFLESLKNYLNIDFNFDLNPLLLAVNQFEKQLFYQKSNFKIA